MNTRPRRAPTTWRETLRRWFVKHIWHHALHWTIVAVLIAGGIYANHLVQEHGWFLDQRYAVFGWLQEPVLISDRLQRLYPNVTVVTIGDEEYGSPELARTSPISRDYLRRLVAAIADHKPTAIALDFRFESDSATDTTEAITRQGPLRLHEAPSRAHATAALCDELQRRAADCHVILPRSLTEPEAGRFADRPHIYDGYPFDPAKVRPGFINLAMDERYVPHVVESIDGKLHLPLSLAIVRSQAPNDFDPDEWLSAETLSSFLKLHQIPTLSANQLLRPKGRDREQAAALIAGKIVLVGGHLYDNGKLIDGHNTPVGELPGVYVHANHVISVLMGRCFQDGGGTFTIILECLFGVGLATVLASKARLWKRWGLAAIMIVLPLAISFAALRIGIFLDTAVISGLLVGKAVTEKYVKYLVIELRRGIWHRRKPKPPIVGTVP